MQRRTITLGHRERGMTAQVWQGGSGSPVVLLHGAWAGARPHWQPVWDRLAERHTVIAPELPGFFPGSGEQKGSYADYADWVDEVMATLQCRPAAVVGNSFGATVAYALALRHADSCNALVLVDGGPPPPLPGLLHWLFLNTPLRRLAVNESLKRVYGPEALQTGFADPARAPSEVQRALQSPDGGMVAHLVRVYLRSAPPKVWPKQRSLVIWGEQDRLPQNGLAAGQHLHQQLGGSAFAAIAGAGHLPQVEQPEAFLQALMPFLAAG